MDYNKIIEELISEFNLLSDLDKKKAYLKCIKYADANLDFMEYNSFAAAAADRLDQRRVSKDTVRSMVKLKGNEKLHLYFSEENGPELVGNQAGLTYLWKLIKNLSHAKLAGEHIHLDYGEMPWYIESYPLTICLEDDKWFAALDENRESVNVTPLEPVDPAHLNTNGIAALILTTNAPPQLLMSKNKIYKVISCERYNNHRVWTKYIRNSQERMYKFQFKRDDGEVQEVAFDLDDQSIVFFTADELKNLIDGE